MNASTTLADLLDQIKNHPEQVEFADVIAAIDAHYDYRPTAFSNGHGAAAVVNAAGTNQGSCRIFAFGHLQGLSEAETLACFGRHYREDVLGNPNGTEHANIRTFMRHGWAGIRFDRQPLTTKRRPSAEI